MLKRLAPAKLNLVLEVLGKGNDGYHEIRSLMQTVSLYDSLSCELAEGISFECAELGLQTADNLVVKAAELLREACAYRKGARIALDKRIPWGAGFGGGSSDAATTLSSLNELWGLGLKASALVQLVAKLGSDVPFFIYGGTALVEGRGEKVTPLPPATGWFVLLVPPLPRMPYKTKQLYSLLDKRHYTEGQFVANAMDELSRQGQVSPSLFHNVFDVVAFDAFHGLEDWWTRFQEAGAVNIHLAGSGPALCAPVGSEARAGELSSRLRQQGLEAYAVSALESWGGVAV